MYCTALHCTLLYFTYRTHLHIQPFLVIPFPSLQPPRQETGKRRRFLHFSLNETKITVVSPSRLCQGVQYKEKKVDPARLVMSHISNTCSKQTNKLNSNLLSL